MTVLQAIGIVAAIFLAAIGGAIFDAGARKIGMGIVFLAVAVFAAAISYGGACEVL